MCRKNPSRSGTVGDASENRAAYDPNDSYDMELTTLTIHMTWNSSGRDWDTYFSAFSYIVIIDDQKIPLSLKLLGDMRTRPNEFLRSMVNKDFTV